MQCFCRLTQSRRRSRSNSRGHGPLVQQTPARTARPIAKSCMSGSYPRLLASLIRGHGPLVQGPCLQLKIHAHNKALGMHV